MDSKTIKRYACIVCRIPVGEFNTSGAIQATYARMLACRQLADMNIEPYDIGKMLGMESTKVKHYLTMFDHRIQNDQFFVSVKRNFDKSVKVWSTKGR